MNLHYALFKITKSQINGFETTVLWLQRLDSEHNVWSQLSHKQEDKRITTAFNSN